MKFLTPSKKTEYQTRAFLSSKRGGFWCFQRAKYLILASGVSSLINIKQKVHSHVDKSILPVLSYVILLWTSNPQSFLMKRYWSHSYNKKIIKLWSTSMTITPLLFTESFIELSK